MIFVDTSALYAVLDRDDDNHASALSVWIRLLNEGETLFTTNYVLVESCALIQNRLGLDAVRVLQDDVLPVLKVEWIDRQVHESAMSAVLAARRRKLSLVDCVSFASMRKHHAELAFAFDQHFNQEGFRFPK
ncbi:MAG: PIN domain-containing protein [Bryobacteraceae bacterium]